MSNGGWIKFRKSLLTDGRVKRMSRNLVTSTLEICGALVALWSLADEHADENGVLDGWVGNDIDDYIGIPNFCSNLPKDWIDLSGQSVKLPQYQEHNGSTAKDRADAVRRQRISREKNKNGHKNVAKKCDASYLIYSYLLSCKDNINNCQGKTELIPDWLNTETGRDALLEWLEYKKARKESYKTQSSFTKLFNVFEPLGDQAFARGVDESIKNNWAGVFPPKANGHGEAAPQKTKQQIIAERNKQHSENFLKSMGETAHDA